MRGGLWFVAVVVLLCLRAQRCVVLRVFRPSPVHIQRTHTSGRSVLVVHILEDLLSTGENVRC